MTTENIASLWNFDSIDVNDTEHQAVILYSRMTRSIAAGKKGLASLVHRVGVSVQSDYTADELKSKKTGIRNIFTRIWESEIEWICSEEAGADQLTEHQTRALDSAFRKVGNTIGYGGDLKVLDTASKCEKFNKEAKAAKESVNLARELREEGESLAAENNLEKGTPEFDKFVAEYIKSNTPDDVSGSKVELSSFQVFAKKIGDKLEGLEKAGMTDKEINDAMQHLETYLQKRLDAFVAQTAVDTALVG